MWRTTAAKDEVAGDEKDAQRSPSKPRVLPFIGAAPKRSISHATDAAPLPKKAAAKASPPVRKPSGGQMRAAFKAAARAVLVPAPKPVSKKTTKRGSGDDALRFSTDWIVADRLGLCRDPYSDLQRWIEFSRKKPPLTRLPLQSSHDRNAALANATKFLRDTLQELSGRVRANVNDRANVSHVPDRSTAGLSEHRQLQQVQGEHRLGRSDASHSGDSTELSSIYGYYAALIAAERTSLRGTDAAGIVRKFQAEKLPRSATPRTASAPSG